MFNLAADGASIDRAALTLATIVFAIVGAFVVGMVCRLMRMLG
jgi:ABC-type amino acid transport system permease subunit